MISYRAAIMGYQPDAPMLTCIAPAKETLCWAAQKLLTIAHEYVRAGYSNADLVATLTLPLLRDFCATLETLDDATMEERASATAIRLSEYATCVRVRCLVDRLDTDAPTLAEATVPLNPR